MNKKEIKLCTPPNLGWIDYRLSKKEMDYVWKCIDNRKEDIRNTLAGNITESKQLIDHGDWFWTNVVSQLVKVYGEEFSNLGNTQIGHNNHPYFMKTWWVNYQKKHEFNPIHSHDGVYSYVIWMKIPEGASCKKQNRGYKTNSPMKAVFQMQYINTLGQTEGFKYELEPEDEGRMLFFPARILHCVYPFYDCNEDRISVSGNIAMNTRKTV